MSHREAPPIATTGDRPALAAPAPAPRLARGRGDFLALALYFVAFLVAHQVGLRSITPHSPLSPVWPPSGVLLGAFLILPRRLRPWMLALTVVADASSNALLGVRMWVGLAYLVPSLLELAVASLIIRWLAGDQITFRRIRDTVALLVAAIVGCAAGALMASVIARVASGTAIAQSFQTWWTADVLGMLLLTPLIVAWAKGSPPLAAIPRARAVEGVAFLAFWSWSAYRIFRGDLTIGWLRPHPYMLASLMTWASFRLGIRGVTTAMTSVAIIAVSVVLQGSTHFPLGDGTLAERLFLVQAFLVIMGVTALFLASALAAGREATDEARDAANQLRRANRALRTIGACNQVLVRATSEQDLLRDICRVTVEEGGFRLAWVGYVIDDEERHVRPVAHHGYEAGYLEGLDIRWSDTERGRGPTGTCIRTGQPVICQDFLTDPTVAPWRHDALARGYRASAVLPLRYEGRVFGTLSVYAPEVGAFDDGAMTLLTELADDMAFGLQALRARDQRVAAERALADSEVRFRQLAENIREIFWMNDARTGETLYISPGVERMLGITAEALVSDPALGLSLIHPDDRARVIDAFARAVAGGEHDEEYRIVRPDGSVRWLHARAFPVRDATGAIYRIVGVSDDITERRSMEEQLRQVQRLEAIGQLAGGVAHDFNNILGAILMQTGLARALPGLSADASALLQDVEASAHRAANLTRQLLLFSRKQVMQPREVELNDLVATLARMLTRVVPEDVQLQLAMHPRQLTVVGDPGMLEQVVMNLTVNARDAMPGGGQLVIETIARDLGADEVRPFPGVRPGTFHGVRVRDSGTGIPPEVRPRIFDPFFTTKEPGKGTGLGLATVFGIVQQHRGVILVHSAVGHGTSIEVLFPAIAGAQPATPPLPLRPRPAASSNATILVVEDDTALRAMLRRVLEQQGYRVHVAQSGREALDSWERYDPPADLLLTDMVMPGGVGGAELAERLLSRAPGLRVLYSSGYDPEGGNHRVRLEPGVNFLQKPASPRQIVEMVMQLLADDVPVAPPGAARESA